MTDAKKIVGLILNIIGLTGIGTLVGGGSKDTAKKQIIVLVIAWSIYLGTSFWAALSGSLVIGLFGVVSWLILFANWIWGIWSGIQLVKN
jgi:hypothetical protein